MRVDELARDVGISKRTLYEQFRTKEDMARKALARRLERLRGGVDRLVATGGDESDQLREVMLLICRVYAKAQPAFHQDLESTPSLTELVAASRRDSFSKIEAVIRSGIDNGRFRADLDPRLVQRSLVAAVEGVLRPEILAEDGVTLDHAFQAILDLILNGLSRPV
ncbi:HTH-type transcriptional repressor KstR2 [Enhygromyxa salina]|uniref:HTH-type transcriptional repressor KstR2 n=2 Tax=Enhygromyxa salina TaxID=215803 RepID=A0A2S9XCB7_9BACT|nr:HTH-type transcriptional repressor KstR2 [Enhygromyxa salina]